MAQLVIDQIGERFNDFAAKLLDEFGEPRSFVLVVDWELGQNDFPAGFMLTRDKELSTPTLLEITSQVAKMANEVLSIFNATLESAYKVNDSLDEELQKKQRLMQELQKEVEELERRKLVSTGNTTDGPAKDPDSWGK